MIRVPGAFLRTAAIGLLGATLACSDVLDVGNPNNPETERVLATPADVEALIRGSYVQVLAPLLQSDGINMQLAAVSFENSPMAANFGMIERSAIPRSSFNNNIADQFHVDYYEVWAESYAAIRSASDGLIRMGTPNFTLGSDANNARAKAFAYFVLGIGHGSLAVTYDKASIYDETVPASEIAELVPYTDVIAASMTYFDKAIQLATTPGIEFPADWLGTSMNGASFARVANSFKARYRTQVARNAAERTAIDWTKAIAEVDAGITADYAPVDNDDTFDYWMHDYSSFKGAWHQLNYFVGGMADQSGAYQSWMALPVTSRTPIVMVTPDKRFPQGADLAAQRLAPGKYYRAKTNNTGEGGWIRAERGTWRWSHYLDDRLKPYYDATNTGLPIPIITKTEMNLIKAEGLFRKGQLADAATLINITRVGNGGLAAVTAAGQPAGSCVPKLPNGTCGNLFETLKWEKRVEQFLYVYGGWFFDSRGWGDLYQGTALHYPVPARELEVRQLPLYTFGAGGDGSAPVGSYGY